VQYGTIEPEAGEAIWRVANDPGLSDLRGKKFALLGAGSAMGPLLILLAHGADVIAVDLDRAPIWSRLIGLARKSCGTITFPLKKPQSQCKNDEELCANAGGNLFTQTPEIANWLCSLPSKDHLTIGSYAYLDGEKHVRVSLAMDAIVAKVTATRPKGSVSLGYLCSPTDVFASTPAAAEAAAANLREAPFWQKLISSLPLGALRANEQPLVARLPIVDGLVVAQGPNYALAKRIQHWRAIVARECHGATVSTNIAPSTATVSVVHNKQFAAAYGGMHLFRPMEIMYQETSNAVMAALLLFDVLEPKSPANPRNKMDHPLCLFSHGSFHGGIWRGAYKIDSIGVISALCYYLKIYGPQIMAVVVAGGAAVGGLATGRVAPPHTW